MHLADSFIQSDLREEDLVYGSTGARTQRSHKITHLSLVLEASMCPCELNSAKNISLLSEG